MGKKEDESDLQIQGGVSYSRMYGKWRDVEARMMYTLHVGALVKLPELQDM